MSDQLSFDAPEQARPPAHRCSALAKVMLPFVRPGYGGASKIPPKVLAEAEKVAERALMELARAVAEVEGRR